MELTYDIVYNENKITSVAKVGSGILTDDMPVVIGDDHTVATSISPDQIQKLDTGEENEAEAVDETHFLVGQAVQFKQVVECEGSIKRVVQPARLISTGRGRPPRGSIHVHLEVNSTRVGVRACVVWVFVHT